MAICCLHFGTNYNSVVNFTLRPIFKGGNSLATCWLGEWVDPEASLNIMEKRKIFSSAGCRNIFSSDSNPSKSTE
jgi:hypothetical protein